MAVLKKLLWLYFYFLCLPFLAYSQDVNIQDSLFLKYLTDHCIGCPNIDVNYDGKIQVSEALMLKSMSGTWGHNSKALEPFKNLTYLEIGDIKGIIDSLDLRANTKLRTIRTLGLPKVKYFNIDGLKDLDTLILGASYGSGLETVNLSTNSNLKYLHLLGSYFSSIDVSKNTKLWYLSVTENNLSCLNLRNNPLLKELYCRGNHISNLDLRNNKELKLLSFGNDNMKNLDLSHNEKLESLLIAYYMDNNASINKLNLSKNLALKTINIGATAPYFPLDSICLYSMDSTFLKKIFIFTSFYNDTVIFTSGCQYEPLQELRLETDTSKICLGTPINLSIQNPDSAYNYQLNYGDGTSSSIPNLQYAYNQSGNKNIQIIADYGCYKDTASTQVMVYATPPVNLFPNYTCTKDTFSLHAGIGYEHYKWQNGDTTESLAITKAGLYKVSASNMCGAITDSTQVQFIKKALQISTPRTCVINESEFAVKNIQYPVLNYHWSLGNGDLFKGSKTLEEVYKYQYPQVGTYKPQLIVDYQCFSDTATTQVIVDDTPILNIGDSILTCKDEVINLDAGKGFTNYLWQDGSSNQTFTANPFKGSETHGGVVKVTVTNACGSQTDSVSIKKVQLWFPNIITPNDDGKNETLEVKSPMNQPIHLQILNRWGQEVYQSDNYKNDWSAKDLSEGVYYFNSHYEGCPVLKGWLQVAR